MIDNIYPSIFIHIYCLEIEWCGALAIIFLTNQYIDSKRLLIEFDRKLSLIQYQLDNEISTSSTLRRSLTQSHHDSRIKEWNLIEQISTLTKALNAEKLEVESLRKENLSLRLKLTETESFMNSEEGHIALKFEEQLAICNLRIAELEAERDYHDLETKKRQSGT